MKVQLILPKCDNPGARLIRGWPQPLGILSIATFLRQRRPDVEIEILDGSVLSREELERRVGADIVGLTTITRGYPHALVLAEKAKKLGAKVVLGGMYATAFGATILENRPFVDAVVKYDGEASFTKYVNGEPLERIENLVYRQSNGVIRENPIKLLDTEDFPIPDRSFLSLPPYDENYARNVGGPFKRGGTVYTQRGCRWRAESHKGCIFCAIPDYIWRVKKPERIWQEIAQLHEQGFEFLYDTCDDIGADKDWLRELRRKKPQIEMHFRHYISAQNVDEETIEALIDIGTVHIFIGFESMDPACLHSMNKEATVKDNERALKILESYKMPLLASFVGGIPGETKESVDRTMDFARYVSESPIAAGIHWDIMRPWPGTLAYKMLLQHPTLGPKYRGRDLFVKEEWHEMVEDWVFAFCQVDYDYLKNVADQGETLVPDTATYAPIGDARNTASFPLHA